MRPCFTASSRNMPELPTVLHVYSNVRARASAYAWARTDDASGKPTQFWNDDCGVLSQINYPALAHVTTYTRPPFYSLGGLGTRLHITRAYRSASRASLPCSQSNKSLLRKLRSSVASSMIDTLQRSATNRARRRRV